MRIISGKFRGRIINPPKNLRARPTTDFAKENLFNVLTNMVDIDDADVLDLFSGTGSVSLEFISRGAGSVTSVEINRVHYNFIKSTAVVFGADNLYAVNANVFLYLKSCVKSFDIVFSDAPYDLSGAHDVVDMVLDSQVLREGGVFIFEHSKGYNFESHKYFMQQRVYGSVHFSFFAKQ